MQSRRRRQQQARSIVDVSSDISPIKHSDDSSSTSWCQSFVLLILGCLTGFAILYTFVDVGGEESSLTVIKEEESAREEMEMRKIQFNHEIEKEEIQSSPARFLSEEVKKEEGAEPAEPAESRLLCLVFLDFDVSDETIETARNLVSIYEEFLSKPSSRCDAIRYYTWMEALFESPPPLSSAAHSSFHHLPASSLAHWHKRRQHGWFAMLDMLDDDGLLDHFDWIVRFGAPNMLVLLENFRRFLAESAEAATPFDRFDSSRPILFGHALQHRRRPDEEGGSAVADNEARDDDLVSYYAYGLAIIIYSVETVRLLGDELRRVAADGAAFTIDEAALARFNTADDFASLDTTQLDFAWSQDEHGKQYILPFQVADHRNMESVFDDWYWRGKDASQLKEGCCADFPIAFGNYPHHELRKMYQMIYDGYNGEQPEYLHMDRLVKIHSVVLPPQ